MNTKNLITELNRSLNLMGVEKKQILSESRWFDAAAGLMKNLLSTEKKFSTVADEVIVGDVKISKKVYDDLLTAADNPSLYDALSDSDKALLGKLAARIPTVVDDTYAGIIDSFIRNTPDTTEDMILESIMSEVQNGKSVNEILMDMTQNDPFVSNLLSKKISKKIAQLFDIPELNTPEKITKFQNWLKETNRWSQETFEQNPKGALTSETRKAWEVNKIAYSKSLVLREKLDIAVQKILDNKIKPVKNGYWDNMVLEFLHPATRFTVFNSLRKSLFFYLKSIQYLFIDTQIAVDNIMQKLLTAIEQQSTDYRTIETLMRDISIRMATLRKSADQRYDLFLNDVKNSLIEARLPSNQVNNVINDLKKYSAWEDMFKATEKPKYSSWLGGLIGESVTAKALKGIFTPWKPDIFVNFLTKIRNLIERSLMFLTTGHIRRISEITEFCLKNGIGKGSLQYIGVLYIMKFLLLPGTISFFRFLKAMTSNLFNPDVEGWAPNWREVFNKSTQEYREMYNKIVKDLAGGNIDAFILDIIPFEWYWDNLDKFGDDVAQQKIGQETRDRARSAADSLRIERNRADSLTRIIFQNTQDSINTIRQTLLPPTNQDQPTPSPQPVPSLRTPTEQEFKNFIKDKFDHFVQFTETGYDTDGNFYFWDKNKNTFYKAGQMEQ